MMDQPVQSTFIRPTKSKAIPIINPVSGERQPIPVVHKPDITFAASQRPARSVTSAKLAPSTPIHVKGPSSIEAEEDPVSESIEQAFNVYARPFVPAALTIINTQHGAKVDTPAINQIDFQTYAC